MSRQWGPLYLELDAIPRATAGTPFSVGLVALDPFNNVAYGYTGTVHFTASGSSATLPADYTFLSSDGGIHIFLRAASLRQVGRQTLTATDTVNHSITGSTAVSVAPAAVSHFAVSAPAGAVAGSAFNVTVTALDPYGNVATAYRGTVHFSSSDSQAVLPGNYAFAAADNGVHTFTVTLKTTATQSLTATDTVTATITGTRAGIGVNPAATARLNVSAPASATAGTAFTLTVTAQDAYGNTTPAYTGTVALTSTDRQATLPANTTLSNGVGTFSIILGTAGTQTVTATDTTSGTITGSATVRVVAGPLDHFSATTSADTGGTVAGNPFDVTVTTQDAYNNTVTTYTGTITFSSQDPYGATLPAVYTFTTGDAGVHTFALGATLYTAGTWDVTATDMASGATGSDFIGVTAAPASAFQVIAPASAASGMAFDVTLVAVDPYGNTDTNYQGMVTWTSTDSASGVVLPADYTFQASDQGVVTYAGGVTLITQGDQFITATDTSSGIIGSADVTVMPGPSGAQGRGKGSQGAMDAMALDALFASQPAEGRDARSWAALAATAHAHRGPASLEAI